MSALASRGSLLRSSATKLSISSGSSPSRASRSSGWDIISGRVLWPSSPRYRLRASTSGSASHIRLKNWTIHTHALGGRPSTEDSWVSSCWAYLHASNLRARIRSSAALRRLTLPISRRYMRTGSSIISTLLRSCPHSASASSSNSASSFRAVSLVSLSSSADSSSTAGSSVVTTPLLSNEMSPSSRGLPNWMRSRADVLRFTNPLSRSSLSSPSVSLVITSSFEYGSTSSPIPTGREGQAGQALSKDGHSVRF